MQIQVHSDNHIEGSTRLIDWVSATARSQLERFEEDLTRIVVHLHDDNADKAGADDKRCLIEGPTKKDISPSLLPIKPNRWISP